MQAGSLTKVIRQEGPVVWQFRWSEKSHDGKRIYRKRIIGSADQYESKEAARMAVTGLLSEINSGKGIVKLTTLTIGQLCDHFQQREMTQEGPWRTLATKTTYQGYIRKWIRPRWEQHELSEVKAVQVESWLRSLPLAKSSCAKIRNVMSILFNHACRYELFDRNPIRFVRQSAKRRATPEVLTPAEIALLLNVLNIRERTLVLVAAGTGLRQSELFGLKWGDIDFGQGEP
jgi:integrase